MIQHEVLVKSTGSRSSRADWWRRTTVGRLTGSSCLYNVGFPRDSNWLISGSSSRRRCFWHSGWRALVGPQGSWLRWRSGWRARVQALQRGWTRAPRPESLCVSLPGRNCWRWWWRCRSSPPRSHACDDRTDRDQSKWAIKFNKRKTKGHKYDSTFDEMMM